jgi:very-short-patch-repair endonuclease
MPHSNIEPRLREFARRNRLAATLGEKEMWTYLRAFRPYGARFRRQAPIGPYIADFAWLSARLVIEVDGATHQSQEAARRDSRRDAFLRGEGFEVLRVNDSEVIANSPGAFGAIVAAIYRRLKTPPPTPPHKREGSRSTP